MDFELSEDHRMLQQSIREFAEEQVAPGAEERDQAAKMPQELIDQVAELGLFGICIPEKYGGAGMDTVSSCLIVEEVSKACAGTGVLVSAHNSLCVDPILHYGTEEQKQKYLPKFAGGTIGCLSLTEPGSGSDANAASCTAVLKDDGWHINGTKCFVTNGGEAGVMVLIAVTDPDNPRRRLSAFIVDKPSEGLRVGKLEKKMGIKCSSTAEFVFEDCVVPKENLLGEQGHGIKVALSTLDGGRLGIAAQALGIAEACLRESVNYANTRVQFNQPIGQFQAIQFKLADMAVGIEAARLLMYRGAWLKDRGQPYGVQAAMAKLHASEVCNKVADEAVQVFGGYGYICDYPVERYYRDAR
ncbi:MAG: acyl-CoA dehydrogenase family protein, partial [Phycisphaerales bacterium]